MSVSRVSVLVSDGYFLSSCFALDTTSAANAQRVGSEAERLA